MYIHLLMFSKQNENNNLVKNDVHVYGIRGSSSQKNGAKSAAEKFVAQKSKTDYQILLACPAMIDEITLSNKTTFHL